MFVGHIGKAFAAGGHCPGSCGKQGGQQECDQHHHGNFLFHFHIFAAPLFVLVLFFCSKLSAKAFVGDSEVPSAVPENHVHA